MITWVVGVSACVIGAFGSFLFVSMRAKARLLAREHDNSLLQQRLDILEDNLAQNTQLLSLKTDECQALQQEKIELERELTTIEVRNQEQLKAAKEREDLLAEAKDKFSDAFKSLSSDALKQNNASFLDLAKTSMERFQEGAKTDLGKRQEAIEDLIKPVKEGLSQFNTKIEGLEKSRVGAYAAITEQMKSIAQSQVRLDSETSNLVKALRAPQVRGQWGELQLKRTVEIAGMLDHVDFYEQVSVSAEYKVQRPDMIVKLPNGRSVIVDAKAPLVAYLESLALNDPDAQRDQLKRHARHIREHLVALGSKSYWKQFDESPEFVILFLPGEAFFSAALEQDPGLIEFGVEQKVILATPTTLIALLKAIAYGWQQEVIAREAKNIAALGKELYERMSVMGGHFNDIRKGLERTVGSYNKAVSSMESRLLPSARKLGAIQGLEKSKLEGLSLAQSQPAVTKAEEFLAL